MSFYSEYLDKDKSLRHYSQHLALALISFFVLSLYFNRIYLDLLFFYILFSYIEDLDGLFTLIIKRDRYREIYEKGKSLFKKGEFKKLAEHFTKEHKKINRLTIHNFLAYPFILIAFGLSIYFHWTLLIYLLAAVLVHLTFDWIDDLYQVRNINNWLWPFKLNK